MPVDAPADESASATEPTAPTTQEPTEPADTGSGADSDDGKAADAKTPNIDGDLDKDRAAKSLAAARAAENKAKARAQAAEDAAKAAQKSMDDIRDKLAVVLGLKPDPQTDPATLVKQAISEREDAIKDRDNALAMIGEMQVETAIVRLATKAGADPGELLDSNAFRKSIEDLEPADDEFETRLLERIKQAVKDNPKRYAVNQPAKPPAKQGTDVTGAGGGARKRPASLGEAVARRYAGTG